MKTPNSATPSRECGFQSIFLRTYNGLHETKASLMGITADPIYKHASGTPPKLKPEHRTRHPDISYTQSICLCCKRPNSYNKRAKPNAEDRRRKLCKPCREVTSAKNFHSDQSSCCQHNEAYKISSLTYPNTWLKPAQTLCQRTDQPQTGKTKL